MTEVAWEPCGPETWRARYQRRADALRYVHLYVYLRKL